MAIQLWKRASPTPCLSGIASHSATHVHCVGGMNSEIAPGTLAGQLETILVVDDNESVLSVVVALLKRANFQVLSADNGANAIELAKQTEGQIDLLLSDVDMPLMSGPDLGEALKKARPDMHVMLMSGGRTEIYWFSITVGPSFRSPLCRRSWFKWSWTYCTHQTGHNLAVRNLTAARTSKDDKPRKPMVGPADRPADRLNRQLK